MTARDHYETLLAKHYTWMFGMPFDRKVAEQRLLLERFDALPAQRRLALDLGAGSGFQSIALLDLGFDQVIAIDFSPTLLAELDSHKQGRPIETVQADIVDYLAQVTPGTVDLITCMGDTLTHLGSQSDVIQLFANAASALVTGGFLVLTYRDLSSEMSGTDRFIPVAADSDRLLTCFLEYEPGAVVVHDLLHEREGERWNFQASTYRKLRLPADWVQAELYAAGFMTVELKPAGRLAGFLARKE
jgi:SAM-dependent methyltransferase